MLACYGYAKGSPVNVAGNLQYDQKEVMDRACGVFGENKFAQCLI
jgi:hypothetical protein